MLLAIIHTNHFFSTTGTFETVPKPGPIYQTQLSQLSFPWSGPIYKYVTSLVSNFTKGCKIGSSNAAKISCIITKFRVIRLGKP